MLTAWVKRKWFRRRARYKMRRRDFPSALAYCERVLSLFPEDAYILCCAGSCHSNLQHHKEAAKFYDLSLQVSPGYGDAHALLGRALLALQKPREAAESMNRAFRMQPKLRKHHVYQVALARALGDIGKTDEALAAYRDAARLDPKDAEALAGIGWALMELGNYKDAEQSLRKAIELDPDYSSPYLSLAYVLQELNRHEESIPFAERFVALKRDDFNGYVRLGWGLGMAGRRRESVHAYKRALELKPDDVAALSGVGLFHYEAGDYKEAIEALEKSISLSPQANANADAYSLIAAARMWLGDLPDAIRANEEAVKLNPELSEAWQNLGQCYMEAGQFEKAIASLEKVFQLEPGIPETHYLLGLTQFKLGNTSAALKQCDALDRIGSCKAQELRAAISGEQDPLATL
jgi:tetratricopeptide (TPR) repeat protein